MGAYFGGLFVMFGLFSVANAIKGLTAAIKDKN